MPKNRKLGRYWQVLAPYRGTILLVFVFAALSMAFGLLQPYLFHYVIDRIALDPVLSPAAKLDRLQVFAGILLVLIAISFLAQYFYETLAITLRHRMTARLRYQLLRRMLHLPLGDLVDMKTGGAVARLNQDTETVSQTANRALVLPGVALLQAVVALVMVFYLNWKLSAAALLVILPLGLLTHLYARRLRPLFVDVSRLGSDLSARSTEMFGGIRVSRIYRREAAERKAYLGIYHQIIRRSLSASRKQIVIDSFWHIGFGLLQITVVLLGVYLIIHGQATVGDILAIIMYSNRIMGPVSQVVGSYGQVNAYLAAMDRIFEVLGMEGDRLDRPGALEAPRRVESLVFENVGFTYRGASRKALSGISFEVRRGQTIALVGKSGAGKSTLTDLVARFHDPQEGAILVNGVDLRQLRVKSYRGLLGLVQQDVFLFDGTVAENIAYGRPGASRDEILAAAASASVDEFARHLPNGYDTVIGERGLKLSVGQRQRISIARAFLADPEILILDEATSNLDTENEQVIQAALEALLKDRTTFIIAHRLSTIRFADTVVVLADGRVQEMGAPDELLARQGLYFEMIERQRQLA